MREVLIVDPESYEGLTDELDELGIQYDSVNLGEASEASMDEFDAVISPGDSELYHQATDSDVPFLAYDPSGEATDRLVGKPGFDARRIAGYTGVGDMESYSRDLDSVVGTKDDMELFLDMIAHDVRNDVNVAMCYLDLMDIDESDQERYDIIKDRLSCIDELMETTETLRQLDEPMMENTDMSKVFINLESDYACEASQKGFDLNFELEDEDITVMAGPLLEDMYGQLITNAFNHSEGTEVEVTASDAERPQVVIEDDGRGIPDAIADNLFQKGVKGEKTGNSGIGTTLVDKIADRYEIDVEVGESDLGGAKFTMHHQPADF